MFQIQHADAVKNSIAEKYVEDVKKLQCRSKSDLQAICNNASTGTKQIIDRYMECSQQNCSLAKVFSYCYYFYMFLVACGEMLATF